MNTRKTGEEKIKRIQTNFRKEDYENIKKVALILGLDLSTFIRQSTLKRLREEQLILNSTEVKR